MPDHGPAAELLDRAAVTIRRAAAATRYEEDEGTVGFTFLIIVLGEALVVLFMFAYVLMVLLVLFLSFLKLQRTN